MKSSSSKTNPSINTFFILKFYPLSAYQNLSSQTFDKTEKRKNYRKVYNSWRRTTVEGRYSKYKQSAKEKGLEFSISIEDFEDWLLTSCIYCGFEEVVGLDRIDNSKGYTQHNVVPCCTLCNKTRSNNFTLEEFQLIGLTIKKIREMRNEV